MLPPKERPEHWIMYFDDSLNLEGAGAGVLLISPQGETAQVCPADTLQGLQQRSRIRSFNPQAPYSSVPWHQATTSFQRFQGRHRTSQQRVDYSKTQWMPTVLKSANSKATSKGLSFSTNHETTTWPPMYSPNWALDEL
jgi:hypothetical protein